MSVNDCHNNILFSWVGIFDKSTLRFIFYRYLGHYDIYTIDD